MKDVKLPFKIPPSSLPSLADYIRPVEPILAHDSNVVVVVAICEICQEAINLSGDGDSIIRKCANGHEMKPFSILE